MTTEKQERRLRAVEEIAVARGDETTPRTWMDCQEDARECWETINSLFCPGGMGAHSFPEREQSYWEERLREEQEIARETAGMTTQQAYAHIIGRIMRGDDAKQQG